MSRHVMSYHVMSCHVISCHVMSCHVMSVCMSVGVLCVISCICDSLCVCVCVCLQFRRSLELCWLQAVNSSCSGSLSAAAVNSVMGGGGIRGVSLSVCQSVSLSVCQLVSQSLSQHTYL